MKELADGPSRKRIGLSVDGRVPARAGATLMDGEAELGIVTSGGFGPTVGAPIAMGYVAPGKAAPGTALDALVRG
ncbi:MAG: glycine cleavage T C-terminal barrel domain-containing protein, partial [Pseudomonadota bacterium]